MERPAGIRQKPWGTSETLYEQPYERADGTQATRSRTERISIEPGGFSSIHRHNQQTNAFYVQKGRLLLKEFVMDGQVPVETTQAVLEADDRPITFAAGEIHQFEALTAVEALEIYVAVGEGNASGADIERFSENGRKLFSFPVATKPEDRDDKILDGQPSTCSKLY